MLSGLNALDAPCQPESSVLFASLLPHMLSIVPAEIMHALRSVADLAGTNESCPPIVKVEVCMLLKAWHQPVVTPMLQLGPARALVININHH